MPTLAADDAPHWFGVLIVEDYPDAAETLAEYLQVCCGYRVTVACDGEEGVRAGLADPPDAVISDIGLPKKDGFRVVGELVASLPHRPLFIAVTAYGEDDMRERAKAAGYDHYLAKPADPRDIEALLRAHERRLAAA